jgi:DNA polymerase-3 subunit epsilon
MFAVVDVETTGGHPSGHNMTEIAIVIYNGNSIINRYSTLLNPGQAIPLNIQSLTGITPDMVTEAPSFAEKATEIKALLADHIFVAHNVNFDLGFVQHAFKKEGINYNPKRLCSVRYARRIEKGLRSYSLKNLCRHFAVSNPAAHRAWADAESTATLLGHLLGKDKSAQWQQMIMRNKGEINLPPNLPAQEFHGLPLKPGVYYFYNQKGNVIYIGKAKNIKNRVASHFNGSKSNKRTQAFKREIHHVHYELTGSDLVASLLEDHEIRHYWPVYNRAQKKPKQRFGVFHYKNQEEQWCLVINRVQKQSGFLAQFYTLHEAQSWLLKQVKEYQLNPKYCGLTGNYMPEIKSKNHNGRFEKLLVNLQNEEQNYLIRTPGRNSEEQGYIWISQGRLKGIGFTSALNQYPDAESITENTRLLRNSITTAAIISKIGTQQKVPLSLSYQPQPSEAGLLF